MHSMRNRILVLGSLALTMIACDFAAAQRAMVGPFAGAARYDSMPMLARPNRLGHVYGNTVRRRYDRQSSYSSPVRRTTNYGSTYGYTPNTSAYNTTYASNYNAAYNTPVYSAAPVGQVIAPAAAGQYIAPAANQAPVLEIVPAVPVSQIVEPAAWGPTAGAVQPASF